MNFQELSSAWIALEFFLFCVRMSFEDSNGPESLLLSVLKVKRLPTVSLIVRFPSSRVLGF